jgi:alkylhydroperoxidase family enzyme
VSALITLRSADFQPAVKRHFDDRQIVEMTVLIATYDINARVLRVLEFDLEPFVPPQSE